MNADLLKLVEFASGFAEKAFERDRYIVPIFHGIKADGEQVIYGARFEDKRLDFAAVRVLFAAQGVARYIFLSEAWVYFGPTLSDADTARMDREGIEHWPGRIEVVAMQAQDNRGNQLMAHREIVRKVNSRPRLGPLKVEDVTAGIASGRMANMLRIADAVKQ